nr:DUF4381 domain-containing protein [uncultured Desulfobulbus sp.]
MDFSQLPLQPYHLPEPVSWWPPALGWWLLAAFIVVLLAGLLLFWKHRRAQSWRRAALHELESLSRSYQQDTLSSHDLARKLSQLLRRVCLTRFEHYPTVTSCTGESWLETLEELSDSRALFTGQQGRELLLAAYDPNAHVGQVHIDLCRSWVLNLPSVSWFSSKKKGIRSVGRRGHNG